MDKKQFLNQYRESMIRINSINEEIAELRETASSISCKSFGSPVVKTSRRSSGNFEAPVEQIAILESRLTDQVKELDKIEKDVTNAIDSIKEPDYANILRYRYINGYTMEQIAEAMSFARCSIHRKYNSAMSALVVPVSYGG